MRRSSPPGAGGAHRHPAIAAPLRQGCLRTWWPPSCHLARCARTCRPSGRWPGSTAWLQLERKRGPAWSVLWGVAEAAKGAARAAAALSGLPGEEVPIEGQTVVGALLWVELRGKNVIPRHGTG